MEHLVRRRSNTQTNEWLVSKPRTDEVICFLTQAAKIRNKRSDAWQRGVNKAQRKWAKRFTHDDFSFESLQHIEVIIDRDDYFPFSVTAIQRDSQLLLFLTLLSSLVCAKAFGKSQRSPTERVTHHASDCQSWFTGLGHKNTEHHFFIHAAPCLFLFCLPNSVLFLSLCEVCSSCCFPCRAYNNVFWHRRVSCSLLAAPPESSQQQCANTVIQNYKSAPLVLASSCKCS